MRASAIYERPIVIGICLMLFLTLTSVKIFNIRQGFGDTAIFLQLTDNIAHGRGPVSEVFANTLSFQHSKLFLMPASDLATNPLLPPARNERNMLHFHAYFILYPIALFALVLPVNVVLMALYVASFIGLLLCSYLVLRENRIPIGAALLFSALVVANPAWSEGLLWGQFYPDRLFVLAGFLFMVFATQKAMHRGAFLIFSVLCLLINERAALIAGLALCGYVGLYWKTIESNRLLRLVVGIGLLGSGVFLTKVWLVNMYYASFLPTSLGQVIRDFHNPVFAGNAAIFFLVGLPLLAVALFEWRAAIIAFACMLPNILGNVGGAEKTAWSTSYHSYYLPILVWAAMLGYSGAYSWVSKRQKSAILLGATAIVAAVMFMLNPDSIATFGVAPRNIFASFPVVAAQQVSIFLRPGGSSLAVSGNTLRGLIPRGATVSTVEGAMPLLYHDRTLHLFPVGIDTADYAVMRPVRTKSGFTYIGAVSFLGADELAKINRTLRMRMRRDGYDFSHAQRFMDIGLAVIPRNHTR